MAKTVMSGMGGYGYEDPYKKATIWSPGPYSPAPSGFYAGVYPGGYSKAPTSTNVIGAGTSGGGVLGASTSGISQSDLASLMERTPAQEGGSPYESEYNQVLQLYGNLENALRSQTDTEADRMGLESEAYQKRLGE